MSEEKPVLWHIGISHYSEKARWALAYKGVEHERKEVPPPAHMVLALAWSRGSINTFPFLELDGERIGDSTAIIGTLEAKYPEPPLYPEDPADRRKALDLEDFFDNGLGVAARLIGWHHMRKDPDLLAEVVSADLPAPLRDVPAVRKGVSKFASSFANARFRVASNEAESDARRTVLEAADRIEQELGGGEYLVGDSFTVADLTAASLFYPLVLPPDGPGTIGRAPASAQPFVDELRARETWGWVESMFAKHRKPVREPATA